MKKNNPHVPIMIREGTGVLPRIYARYGELELRPYWSRYVGGSGLVVVTDGCTDLGQEKSRSLEGMFPHVFKWECRSKANGLGQQVSAISRLRRRLRGSSRPRALRAAPSRVEYAVYTVTVRIDDMQGPFMSRRQVLFLA